MSISHATGWKIQWVYLLSLVAEFGVTAIIGNLGGEGVAGHKGHRVEAFHDSSHVFRAQLALVGFRDHPC